MTSIFPFHDYEHSVNIGVIKVAILLMRQIFELNPVEQVETVVLVLIHHWFRKGKGYRCPTLLISVGKASATLFPLQIQTPEKSSCR